MSVDIIESHKRVYDVLSNKSGNIYSLLIIKEKKKDVYRIINLSKGHICPNEFPTYEDAEDSIYAFQAEGRHEILDIYSIAI